MNTGAPFPELVVARERVLHFQCKLHEWASDDAERRFCDLWNLVCDPATLVVAWSRVSRNRGSRTAGVDAGSRRHVEARGVDEFLWEFSGDPSKRLREIGSVTRFPFCGDRTSAGDLPR